jgi:hypothetical protein
MNRKVPEDRRISEVIQILRDQELPPPAILRPKIVKPPIRRNKKSPSKSWPSLSTSPRLDCTLCSKLKQECRLGSS